VNGGELLSAMLAAADLPVFSAKFCLNINGQVLRLGENEN